MKAEIISGFIGIALGIAALSILLSIKQVAVPDPGHYCVGEYKVYFLGRVSDGQAYVIMPQGRTAYIPLEELRDCQLL